MEICRKLMKYCKPVLGVILLGIIAFIVYVLIYRYEPFRENIEIVDELGGNIFPSAIISVATTDAQVIRPDAERYVGNPKSSIAVRVKSHGKYSRVRINLEESPFFSRSISEFVLEEAWKEYIIYPDIIWKYDALINNVQPVPVNVSVEVEINGKPLGYRLRTFSMRSVNECLLGYRNNEGEFEDTSVFFAAYVNEDNPLIDGILREALNTRLVSRFTGYQAQKPEAIDRQVYALWNVLQKRNFRYSSISNTSLSSNLVFAQRVRTFEDALESSQINCVDGSVLFASLLTAINIDPILVRTPGHMVVGYFIDKGHEEMNFLETTMIGDVDFGELFPGEEIDAVLAGKTQNELSRFTFDKSKEYAADLYRENKEKIHSGEAEYMFLEISKEVRAKIQPIGK